MNARSSKVKRYPSCLPLQDIMADGSPGVLRNALNHIKNILITPIKPYGSTGIPDSSSVASAGFGQGLHPESPTESEQGSGTVPEGDLPGQITRFMGKSKCAYT